MNIYEFLSAKNNNIKITSDKLNVVSILKAFNTIELNHDKVQSIFMNEKSFNSLVEISQQDILENNIYQKIIENKEIFNVKITIDNTIEDNIVKIKGVLNTVEMFVGKF